MQAFSAIATTGEGQADRRMNWPVALAARRGGTDRSVSDTHSKLAHIPGTAASSNVRNAPLG